MGKPTLPMMFTISLISIGIHLLVVDGVGDKFYLRHDLPGIIVKGAELVQLDIFGHVPDLAVFIVDGHFECSHCDCFVLLEERLHESDFGVFECVDVGFHSFSPFLTV